MYKVKTERVNVTIACRNCQKAKKKCSDYNHNSSCERCVERELECKYVQPVKKRGPRPIHVNGLNVDYNKFDPLYNNKENDKNEISNLSLKYDLHENAVKDLIVTYPKKSFANLMTVLSATSDRPFEEDQFGSLYAKKYLEDQDF
ncbi:hypothetical protein Glove_384g59 [Diversispora epigaea]|uniref:Zn(2)-C6 fungal-type domain-containing protein n=1 Tax=Diversispora epigaea TaxID=1348612 RepID=A0A397H730_9GLOM|nr:hypothetical protein Glove_384g59 [Diversispora epigaea]